MIKLYNLFKLYVTKANGIRFPKSGVVVFLNAEDTNNALDYIDKLGIPSYNIKYIGYLKKYRVVNSVILTNTSAYSDFIKNTKLPLKVLRAEQIFSNGYNLYMDMSQYSKVLLRRYNGLMQYKRVLEFLEDFSSIAPKEKYSDKILILIKDPKLTSSNYVINSIVYALRKNIEIPFSKIFLFLPKTAKDGEHILIYDKYSDKNSYSRVKSIVSKYYNIDVKTIEKEIQKSDESIKTEKAVDVKSLKAIMPNTLSINTGSSVHKKHIETIVNKLASDKNLDQTKKDLVKQSLEILGSIDPSLLKDVDVNDPEAVTELVKTAISTVVSGDVNKVRFTTTNVSDIDSLLTDLTNILHDIKQRPIVSKVTSKDAINSADTVDKMIGDLKIDINLSRRSVEKRLVEQWLYEVAKTLSTRDIPLEIQNVEIDDYTPENDETEVEPSAFEEWRITYKSVTGSKQVVSFIVPKLVEDRFTLLGGTKGYFPYIMVTMPIFVRNPGDVMFITTYAGLNVYLKEKKGIEATWIKIAGTKMPLVYILGLLKPIPETLKEYNIDFEIVQSVDEHKDECVKYFPVQKNEYICVKTHTIDKEVEDLLNGFYHINFKSKLPVSITDDRFSIQFINEYFSSKVEFQVSTTLFNIVDPITKKFLMIKSLPYEIYDILKYCNNLAAYKVNIDKFNIENIRLRQQDVILEAIYKVLNKAYSKYRYEVLSNVKNPKLNVDPKAMIKYLRETTALDILEEQSPVEELSALNKVKLVGPGGLPSSDSVTVKDRSLRESHFGTFDPIDTSEGDPGAYQHLTVNANMLSLFGTVAKYPLSNDNNKISSPAASLIPFIEKDDGNRALMACNQMRQVMPLVFAEPPLVQTGYESIYPSLISSAHVVRAKQNGKVLKIEKDFMVVEYEDKTKEVIDLKPHALFGMVSFKVASIKTPVKKEGERFSKNDILAANSYVNKETLQLQQGRNAVVAFMLYDGYNFEDGIVVTESFAKKFTSIHHETFFIKLSGTRTISSMMPVGTVFKKGDVVVSVTSKNSEDTRDYIASYDGKVVDMKVFANSPLGNQRVLLERIKEVDNKILEENKILKKYGASSKELMSEKLRKFFGNFKYKGDLIDGILVLVDVIYTKKLDIGDKLHNRHGNKGVVCKIISDEEAPRLPDGTPVELMFTTLGVVGRMNMGQVFELYTGRILFELERRIKENLSDKKKVLDLISKVYSILDTSEKKQYSKSIIQNIDKHYAKFVGQLKRGLHLTLIVKQFSNLTLDDLEKAYKVLGIKFAEYLYLPKYDVKTKNPVSVGVQFIEKLEHMADIKETARSFGKYNPVTEQAVRGRKHGGGQRVGEMDTWAYLAYESENILKDFLAVSGDNMELKRSILRQISLKGEAHLPEETQGVYAGAKQALKIYLIGMGVVSLSS